MSNWIDKDEGFIPLKKFRHLDIDYIRIYPKDNVILGKTRRETKTVSGIEVSIQKQYWVHIPISPTRDENITVFHLHSTDAETFLTLLNLLPDRLYLRYYRDNQSQNMKEWGVFQECLAINGLKCDKNGRVKKTYSVTINGYIRKSNNVSLAGYGDYKPKALIKA